MKKLFSFLLILTAVYACSKGDKKDTVDAVIERGNPEELIEKRAEVLSAQDSISNLLRRIETALMDADTSRNYPLVTTYSLKDTLFRNFISLQGNVETSENILLYPEYQGVLTQIFVKEGQEVGKGKLLAKIDDGGLSNQLAQAETQYRLAKTTYERQERLWAQNIGSEIQYLQAKTNMEALENTVEQLRSQLRKTEIRAPFSGVVDAVITDAGQVVSPGGQPVFRLISLGNMKVTASVPENYLGSVTKGSPVEVTFPAISRKTEEKIATVGNFIDPANRTFQVEIRLQNSGKEIKPNLIAVLKINTRTKENALTIPVSVIQENAKGEKYVFVLAEPGEESSKVKRTKIETGIKEGGFVEVLNGLETGDVIVDEGALSLKDGAMVTIKRSN